MSILAKGERGFSLIELTVVIAIIGFLVVIGMIGYQDYLDGAKKSFTVANARAVQQWILRTDTIRDAGIETDPITCSAAIANSETTIQSCLAVIGGMDGPFATFQNPYTPSRTGATAIRGLSTDLTITSGATLCSAIDAGSEVGDVLVSVGGTLIQTFYCVPAGNLGVLVTETGWNVDWK